MLEADKIAHGGYQRTSVHSTGYNGVFLHYEPIGRARQTRLCGDATGYNGEL
jgi:hypothetical protein